MKTKRSSGVVGAHDRDHDVRNDDRPAPADTSDEAHGPGAAGALAAERLEFEGPAAIERPVAGRRDQRARRARRRGDRGGQVLHAVASTSIVTSTRSTRSSVPTVPSISSAVPVPRGSVVGVSSRSSAVAASVGAGGGRGAGREPGLGEPHGGARVNEAVAVVVAEVLAAAVPGRGPVPVPAEALVAARRAADPGADVPRRRREDRLHVAPAEPVLGLEHQRDDPGHHRRCRRGAVEVGVVAGLVAGAAGPVGGDDLPNPSRRRRRAAPRRSSRRRKPIRPVRRRRR